MREPLIACVMLVLVGTTASAQKWKDIGKTAAGNMVSVDPKSVVKKSGGLVEARIRVVFVPPLKAQRGTWASSRTSATFDCGRRYLAVANQVYYSDAKSTIEIERSVNKKPGFGPALGGSFSAVALDYLCKDVPKG